jgi:hypothetical protein
MSIFTIVVNNKYVYDMKKALVTGITGQDGSYLPNFFGKRI